MELGTKTVNCRLFTEYSNCIKVQRHFFYTCLFAAFHCVKSVRIRSFSGPYFPAFGLNTPYLSVFSPNTGKYRPEKLRIRTLFTQCQTNVQKHIGLYLDEKCNTHKRSLLARFTGLGLLRNLSDKFPKQALVTIYKTFIRLHLFMVILCVISHIIKHLVTKLMVQLKDHLGRNCMLNLTLNKT